MRNAKHALLRTALLLAVLAQGSSAQEWARFRGPGGSGVRADSALPAAFTQDHVLWRVPVGGAGSSSPVLFGDRVFLTREGSEPGTRSVVAFSQADGSLLWSYDERFEPEAQHRLNSHAASTPAVDATGVYVSWTSAGKVTAVALGLDGAHRWSAEVGTYEAQHGGGTSPALFGDDMVIANEHAGEGSSIVGLNKTSPGTKWTIVRQPGPRRASYASPVLYERAGQRPLLIFASTVHGLTAVDPERHEIAWELDLGFKQRFVGLPALAGDILSVSAGSGGGGQEATILRLPGGAGGPPDRIATPRRNLPYVPGQLALDGRFYLVSDGGIASCLRAETGEVVWSERLDGTFFSSPVSNGEVIWIVSREGHLISLAPGDEFRLLGDLDLGAPAFATPALGADRMLLRTDEELICLGVANTEVAREMLVLWPDGAPDEPAGIESRSEPPVERADGRRSIRYVDAPTLTVYRAPAETANGCCVVVAPGGGYNLLAWTHEGTEVAEWLNTLGITAVLLEYRVPRRDPKRPHVQPLQDAQRAIRLTRQHAEAWGIDPGRVGMIGFSAGGHLTLATGTHPGEPGYPRVDDADSLSARPDFLMPIYAAYLADPADPSRLAPEIRLTRDTPPTFMAVTLDDQSRGADAARVLIELKRHGVEAELHVFTKGGHGYGLRDIGQPVNGWPRLCADWMAAMGWLDRAPEKR